MSKTQTVTLGRRTKPSLTCLYKRWMTEYSRTLLQKRTASTLRHRDPKIDDVALIADNSMPRELWPRGRRTRVIPGRDDKVRMVEVKTATGILKRPTSRPIILSQSRPFAVQRQSASRQKVENVSDLD
ncbi:hypothetical protein EVAR_44222_1 [Eumeta japonica]|uniref:DUF5641 domain-containing protein n=1 Tax=Eumeta variegata TaxID=151549 RepID=A0A4C1W3F0_EUMVA|nr:hypothetical protein EVAR_44222_1 [Eumeta japonica]